MWYGWHVLTDNFSPDQLSAFWAGVTGVSAVITGAVAIISLRALRQDSRDRTRPVVVADLLPVVLSRTVSELVIENVGPSVAKKVRVTFEPPITEDVGTGTAFLVRRYSHIIPTMGPGRRLTNTYAIWVGDGSDNLLENVPKDVVVRISYQDAHGRNYSDDYELSLRTLRNQTSSEPSNTDSEGMRRRWVRALEEIARGVSRR
jgi:hypothetical protein